jgi:uncharacterized protein (TIGR02265 family)
MRTSPSAMPPEASKSWVGVPTPPPVEGTTEALDTPSAVAWRLTQASQRDVVAGMFFLSTMEEIARLASPTAADAARRLALGSVRRAFEPFYRYPVVELLRLMDMGAKLVGGDYAAVLARFGCAATQAFLDSPMGRTLLLLGGKEPHRLLLTLASGHHAPASFSARTYQRIGPNSAVIHYSAEMLGPSWSAGSIEQSFQAVFGFRPRVHVLASLDTGALDLLVRW